MVCPCWEGVHPNPAFYYQKGAGPLMDMGPYYLDGSALSAGTGPPGVRHGGPGRKERTVHTGPYTGRTIEVDPEVMTHVIANLEFQCGAADQRLLQF